MQGIMWFLVLVIIPSLVCTDDKIPVRNYAFSGELRLKKLVFIVELFEFYFHNISAYLKSDYNFFNSRYFTK